MNIPIHLLLLTAAFIAPLATQAQSASQSGTSMLRVVCDGDDVGAEVSIDGVFKGECPLDMTVRAGTLKLRMVKKVDTTHERVFEQEIRMGDGTVKKIEASLGSAMLSAEGRRQEQEAAKLRQQQLAPFLANLKAQGVEPGNGKPFRDCAECPEMVLIPAGSFTMGSGAQEQAVANGAGLPKSITDREGPQRSVSVQNFAMGKTEVTRGQFAAFVAASGHNAGSSCYVLAGGKWTDTLERNWRNPGFAQTDNDPVACVSWDDAQAYVRWLTQKAAKSYRLPSEAEWEYAARASSTGMYFSFGEDPSQLSQYAWFSANSGNQTHPVAQKRPNAFGLYDVHGNVWEWVEDVWHDNYNSAPTDGSAWTSGGDHALRVQRGGSWNYFPGSLRSAIRSRDTPVIRYVIIGFRIARTL